MSGNVRGRSHAFWGRIPVSSHSARTIVGNQLGLSMRVWRSAAPGVVGEDTSMTVSGDVSRSYFALRGCGFRKIGKFPSFENFWETCLVTVPVPGREELPLFVILGFFGFCGARYEHATPAIHRGRVASLIFVAVICVMFQTVAESQGPCCSNRPRRVSNLRGRGKR